MAAGLVIALLAFVSASEIPAAAQPSKAEPPVLRRDSDDQFRDQLRQIRRQLADNPTPNERALLLRKAADLEIILGNFWQAARDIEATFETGVLRSGQKAENYYLLGGLYLSMRQPNYEKSIKNFEKYLKVAINPNPDAYFYIGQAQALQGKCREAISSTQKALKLTQKPRENHYRLLLFCYRYLRRYRDQVVLLERMAKLFPPRDEYGKYLEDARRKLKQSAD